MLARNLSVFPVVTISLLSALDILLTLCFVWTICVHQALVAKDSKFRSKFRAVSKRWPNLRATAVVGMGVDFTLIPRAMQAEEDLLRYLNEFRNIETAQSLTSRMTSV
jgi:hypothetical protein